MAAVSAKQAKVAVGAEAELVFTVTPADTAISMGSGRRDVLATPAVVAKMEAAAQKVFDFHAPPDHESVGTLISVEHSSMTPVGETVRIVARVTAVEKRTVTFEIDAFDTSGHIAHGSHERILAPSRTFLALMASLNKK